ncbi:unnamed protein product [Pseudo-nitzschia multistriata]|uniref:Nitroreductase domain-containing protein n=1 Tax=Pseudo-nitzschia multistriata TaxID=183589 RepID=A0A448Z174_9STRA|nr:unnamed protein product [Pseudo-nitzschia multistriata]
MTSRDIRPTIATTVALIVGSGALWYRSNRSKPEADPDSNDDSNDDKDKDTDELDLSVLPCIRNRRSVFPSSYLKDPPPLDDAIVRSLLEAARWGPFHGNNYKGCIHPARFVVLGRKAAVEMQEMTLAYYDRNWRETGWGCSSSASGEDLREEDYREWRERTHAEITGRWAPCSHMIAIVCRRQSGPKRLPEWEEAAAVAAATQNMHLQSTRFPELACYWSSWHAAARDSAEMKDFLGMGPEDRCMGIFVVAQRDPRRCSKTDRRRRDASVLEVEWRPPNECPVNLPLPTDSILWFSDHCFGFVWHDGFWVTLPPAASFAVSRPRRQRLSSGAATAATSSCCTASPKAIRREKTNEEPPATIDRRVPRTNPPGNRRIPRGRQDAGRGPVRCPGAGRPLFPAGHREARGLVRRRPGLRPVHRNRSPLRENPEACAGHEAFAPWVWTRHLAYLESLRGLSLERCASATLGRDLGSLKALRSLALRGCATSSAEGLLAGILAGTHRFRTTLAHLAIRDCGLTGDHLGVLLKGVVPLLPNLETLDLYGNRIGSFRPAAESLDRAAEGHACLHTLLVAGNPIEDWYRFGPTEADALLAILRAFPRLSWVTHLREGGDAHPRVELTMRTNYAGRVLLGAGTEAATAPEGGEEPRGPRPPSVPVSAWPRVLERAAMWKRFMDCNDTNVTGIYYLLRCGPALHS